MRYVIRTADGKQVLGQGGLMPREHPSVHGPVQDDRYAIMFETEQDANLYVARINARSEEYEIARGEVQDSRELGGVAALPTERFFGGPFID